MSTEPRVVLSFSDCKTPTEAWTKYRAWVDAYCDGLVREHAARLLAADETCEEIVSQVTQFRGALARQRYDLLERFVEILEDAAREGPSLKGDEDASH